MTAKIIPFPGTTEKPEFLEGLDAILRAGLDEGYLSSRRRSARKNGKYRTTAEAPRTAVVIEQMKNYRILSRQTMRSLSLFMLDFRRCVAAYKATGIAPSVDELEALMGRYCDATRGIDWAHKFLVVHGDAVGETSGYEQLRTQFSREIYNNMDVQAERLALDWWQ